MTEQRKKVKRKELFHDFRLCVYGLKNMPKWNTIQAEVIYRLMFDKIFEYYKDLEVISLDEMKLYYKTLINIYKSLERRLK